MKRFYYVRYDMPVFSGFGSYIFLVFTGKPALSGYQTASVKLGTCAAAVIMVGEKRTFGIGLHCGSVYS